MQKIMLSDEDGEIDPVPIGDPGGRPETLLDRLFDIIQAFNDLFVNIDWRDEDHLRKLITETIPARVADDEAFRNARKHSDPENARIESDKALGRVMTDMIADDMELFRHFADDEGFRKWVSDAVFEIVYHEGTE